MKAIVRRNRGLLYGAGTLIRFDELRTLRKLRWFRATPKNLSRFSLCFNEFSALTELS